MSNEVIICDAIAKIADKIRENEPKVEERHPQKQGLKLYLGDS